MRAGADDVGGMDAARANDRLRVLSEAMHAFADATTDAKRLLEGIARRVAEVVKDACIVLTLSEDGKWLTPVALYGPDEEYVTKSKALLATPLELVNHALAKTAIETGTTQWVSDLNADELSSPAEYRRLVGHFGVHSLLVVPLRAHGVALGLFTVLRSRSGPFDRADRELAENLADHASLALGNARAYAAERAARDAAELAAAALQRSEARFSRLAESGTIGILVANPDGRILEINEALLQMIGYSREEILAGTPTWRELTPPEWHPVDARAIAQLQATGVAALREKEYLHKNGTRVPVLAGSAMIASADEAISFVVDLSERKRSEATLARLGAERAADALARGLLEAAPDAMVIVDESGRIALVNVEAERVFGYGREELLGQPAEILVPERLRTAVPGGWYRTEEARIQSRTQDYVGRRRDGTEFPAEIRIAFVRAVQAALVTLAVRDVTERQKADEARFRLAALVETSDDAIIGTTVDGLIVSWNASAERLFGYAAEQAIGHDVAMLVPAGREDEEATLLALLQRGESVGNFETVRRRSDGRELHVSVTTSLVRDASGAILGASKVARDITARKQNEEALLRAKEAAENANRELEAFSYSAAHDLRAPLRSINGFSHILLEESGDKLDAESQGFLRDILRSTKTMAELIDALLSLSKVTRAPLVRERVNLGAVAREIVAPLVAADAERRVEVVIAEDLASEMDPVLARALLDNLIGNAWKFSGRAAAPRIEVGARADGEHGSRVFFVRDNGVGFEMSRATHLFAPFQRLHTTKEFPGTGIGLATVQRIVHRHGGRIWAEARVGEGATFFFTLPADRHEAST